MHLLCFNRIEFMSFGVPGVTEWRLGRVDQCSRTRPNIPWSVLFFIRSNHVDITFSKSDMRHIRTTRNSFNLLNILLFREVTVRFRFWWSVEVSSYWEVISAYNFLWAIDNLIRRVGPSSFLDVLWLGCFLAWSMNRRQRVSWWVMMVRLVDIALIVYVTDGFTNIHSCTCIGHVLRVYVINWRYLWFSMQYLVGHVYVRRHYAFPVMTVVMGLDFVQSRWWRGLL